MEQAELYARIGALRKAAEGRAEKLRGDEVGQAYERGYRTVCSDVQKKKVNLKKVMGQQVEFYDRELLRHRKQDSTYDIQWDLGAHAAIRDICAILGMQPPASTQDHTVGQAPPVPTVGQALCTS